MITELVGVPGSGKSTLYDTLSSSNNSIKNSTISVYRGLLLIRLLQVSPLILKMFWQSSPRVNFLNLRSILTISSLKSPSENLLLDQGPIFDLAQLVFDNIVVDQGWYYRLLCGLIRSVPCRVIFIEIDFELAYNRIKARDKHHRFKKMPLSEFAVKMTKYKRVLLSVMVDCRVEVEYLNANGN